MSIKELKNEVVIIGKAHSISKKSFIYKKTKEEGTMLRVNVAVESEGKKVIIPTISFHKNTSKLLSMALNTLDSLLTVSNTENPEMAELIKITGEMSKDDKGNLQIESKFFNKVEDINTVQGAVFNIEGIFKGILKDDKMDFYNIGLYHLGYNDRLKEVVISVPVTEEKKLSAIDTHYSKGVTINLTGNIVVVEKITKSKQEMLMGDPIDIEKIERKYLAVLDKGSSPYKGDEAVSDERLKKALTEAAKYATDRANTTSVAATPAFNTNDNSLLFS